jgi:endoglucanase
MEDSLRDRLAAWTALDAPVGFEEPVLRAARDALARVCPRVEVDTRGNVYGWQPGTDPQAPLVMVTAHADEIGFLVTSLDPTGFLRFARLGHPNELVLAGQRVRVLSRTGPVEGVIGVKPAHILTPDEARRVPGPSELYVDVGATSAAELVEWGIESGTPMVLAGELVATRNARRCFGKCVDNRIGLVCLLEIAERLAASGAPAATVVHVVTVEEEVGLRGAEVAARRVNPDVLLVLDTVPSGGTPDLRPQELPWDIGEGPLLKVREIKGLSTHAPLRALLRATAQAHGIPHRVIVDTAGITDATSAQQASGDIAAMVLALARRYSHTAVEMCDLGDAAALIELTCRAIPQITSRQQLQRL